MKHNPVCGKCDVAKALHELTDAYNDFVFFLEEKDLALISAHARGYCHG